MNKWVKRKWVRALRSGEYTQGQGWLVQGTDEEGYRHCCLGVLACEMVPEYVRRQGTSEPGVDKKTDLLPDDLGIMFGLDFATQDRLAELNDQGGSFTAIANWIDKHL